MSYKRTVSSRPPTKSFRLYLQPAPAWSAILGLVILLALGFVAGAGRLLIPIFPLSAFAIGVFLYRRYPVLYIGFTWWLWFLSPFVRRLIDYQSGYRTPWPEILAPLLVTAISFATLVRHLPKFFNQDGLPFILCIGSVLYGFLVGLIRQPITDFDREIIILLSWLSPIAFGFHLFVNWRNYPSYRQNIQRVFFWGVLVMGVYGIWQFLVAPAWDRFFLTIRGFEEDQGGWMGNPKPFEIRVWSTMSGPRQFAANLVAGLVLLFISQEKLRFAAAGVGYLAFLLSRARTGWYTWLVALLLFIVSLKGRRQLLTIVGIAVLTLLVLLLTTIEPFSTVIGSRLETFSDLSNDVSLQSRLEQYNRTIDYALSEYLGWGIIGNEGIPTGDASAGIASSNDNGYLRLLISLGWLGMIPYLIGIALLFFKLFQPSSQSYLDIFAIASRAIALSSVVRMATSDISSDDYAMPIWGFLGLAIAAHKYYSHERTVTQERG